uniref:ARAD1A00946p n=1 Tax=Blastobotrys adeninivorans TaxID=409370 RepID=A0A060SX04_BLAAD
MSEEASQATQHQTAVTDRKKPTEEEFLASFPQKYNQSSHEGYPGFLNQSQMAALDTLRKQLKDAGYTKRLDDATLLRFLRARKFDVAKAREMFEKCEKWRKEFGTDTVLEDFHYVEKSKVAQYYPQYYHKTDKDGRPVYFEELGKVKINEMYKITTQERMLRNLVWEYESFVNHRLPACSRQKGELVETSCTILDLKGISLTSASQVYSYVREASNIGQNYYPERMGKFYVINAPFGFSTVFAMIKPFLDPVTVEKIHILGSRYQDELLKQIPAENLPKKFGGKSESAGGVEMSDDGPWRDEKFQGPEGPAPRAAEGFTPSATPSATPSLASRGATPQPM